MQTLFERYCNKMKESAFLLGISLAYLPFLLIMQYTKQKWLIARPDDFWDYIAILHSEASSYFLLAALFVALEIRSRWGAYLLLTVYYLLCLLDNVVWFTFGRPFHPGDFMRGVEFLQYYSEFLTLENIGWKRVIYTIVPLATGSIVFVSGLRESFGKTKVASFFRQIAFVGASAALVGFAAFMPIIASGTYLHYNSLVRIGKQIYQDRQFASGQISAAEKKRLFGPFLEAGAKVPKRRVSVILYVLETAPADLFPDLSAFLRPWADRNDCLVQTMPEHYTTYPESDRSLLSIMTGKYPCLNRGSDWIKSYDYGRALPKVLNQNGYETHLISVAPLNFHNGNIMINNLGFKHISESAVAKEAHHQAKSRKTSLDRKTLYDADQEMLEQALHIITAQGENPYLLTLLPQASHAPFQIPPGYAGPPGERELFEANARWQMGLLSRIMKRLEDTGQAQSTILIIAGDHGLRHPAESSLYTDQTLLSPLTFKVTFACCYPKDLPLLKQTVSSHVDITPTLLDLLGIVYQPEGYHGRSMLTVPSRAVFFLGGDYLPVSGFTVSGSYFMENINRNIVLKSSRFDFNKLSKSSEKVDIAEQSEISHDLGIIRSLLTD